MRLSLKKCYFVDNIFIITSDLTPKQNQVRVDINY